MKRIYAYQLDDGSYVIRKEGEFPSGWVSRKHSTSIDYGHGVVNLEREAFRFKSLAEVRAAFAYLKTGHGWGDAKTSIGRPEDTGADAVKELAALKKFIAGKAREIAPDYPGVDGELGVYEHLWAITSSAEGCSLACDDWYNLVKGLMAEYGLSEPDIQERWKKVLADRPAPSAGTPRPGESSGQTTKG